MSARRFVDDLARLSEINQVRSVRFVCQAHQYVVRIDVTVHDALLVQLFQATEQLVEEKEHGLECELTLAEVEQVLHTRSKQV